MLLCLSVRDGHAIYVLYCIKQAPKIKADIWSNLNSPTCWAKRFSIYKFKSWPEQSEKHSLNWQKMTKRRTGPYAPSIPKQNLFLKHPKSSRYEIVILQIWHGTCYMLGRRYDEKPCRTQQACRRHSCARSFPNDRMNCKKGSCGLSSKKLKNAWVQFCRLQFSCCITRTIAQGGACIPSMLVPNRAFQATAPVDFGNPQRSKVTNEALHHYQLLCIYKIDSWRLIALEGFFHLRSRRHVELGGLAPWGGCHWKQQDRRKACAQNPWRLDWRINNVVSNRLCPCLKETMLQTGR